MAAQVACATVQADSRHGRGKKHGREDNGVLFCVRGKGKTGLRGRNEGEEDLMKFFPFFSWF